MSFELPSSYFTSENIVDKKILVTGSSGHLGEAIIRTLWKHLSKDDVIGVDVLTSPTTTHVGSIADKEFVDQITNGVNVIFHTATLHKPHVATHPRQAFVDTNITGTLNLLESVSKGGILIDAFIFTSSTSVFGDALVPPEGQAAAWITEEVQSIPKNIYGITKSSAEDLCQLFNKLYKLPTMVLRTSRFFPEDDDNENVAASYINENSKLNEYLYRRVDIEDVVSAHLLAAEKAKEVGFMKLIITATSPFERNETELLALRLDAPRVIQRYYPQYDEIFQKLSKCSSIPWRMFPSFDRVYVNEKARRVLGWNPKHSFESILVKIDRQVSENNDNSDSIRYNQPFTWESEVWSPLAKIVGSKGYHR